MPVVRIQEAASWRLDEIYRYTSERWGEAQAERYVSRLFEAFGRIDAHGLASKPVRRWLFFPPRASLHLLAAAVERRHRHCDHPA